MNFIRHGHIGGTRRAGIVLAGLLALGLAGATGTALAASSSPSSSSMADMTSTPGLRGGTVGTTSGWLDGKTVKFYYSKNFYCAAPPASTASSKCEGGTDYTQAPASGFDPLYVVVPLGFTPPKSTLQCPTAGKCVDHPSTIDLTAVLGAGTANLALPPHSHIVATNNGKVPEWWNVDIVGVKSLKAWNHIVAAKSDKELQFLQRTDSSAVTGNITTNLFLWFAVS